MRCFFQTSDSKVNINGCHVKLGSLTLRFSLRVGCKFFNWDIFVSYIYVSAMVTWLRRSYLTLNSYLSCFYFGRISGNSY